MIKLTFYSGKLWQSEKPFPVKPDQNDPMYSTMANGKAIWAINHVQYQEAVQVWLSTAYEVVNPEVIPGVDVMLNDGVMVRADETGNDVEPLQDGDEITLPDNYIVSLSRNKSGIIATIVGPPEKPNKPEDKTFYAEPFPDHPYNSPISEKPDNGAHGDSFENHPLNFVAGPKPKPSREERHKRLADKIQQAKKEKITESFTRLEMEKMFCMGMLNQRSESIVDLLSEQLPEAQSKMDKIIEEIKNRRVEPSESQEETAGIVTPGQFIDLTAVAEHAHSEGKKEGWNEALDDIQTRLMTEYRRLSPELIYDELQKLRK